MLGDLKNHIVFLHGLSGSGKGELQRRLAESYSSHGYDVIYISSGALFRAALSDPVIAEQVGKGYFFDTLGAIMPGIKKAVEHFLKRWVDLEGKSIIILDGLIRRGEFVNKEDILIPSQIEQIAVGLHKVIKGLAREDENFNKYFPEYGSEDEDKEENLFSRAKQALKDATHIVVDVLPEDAEAQIKRRAEKEINSIRVQLQNRLENGQIDPNRKQYIEDHVLKLEAILHGGIRKEGDSIVYLPNTEWDDKIEKDLYPLAAMEVKQIRKSLAHIANLEDSAPLTASFESFGVFTELRDDDISPIGRETRIENYTKVQEEGDRLTYEPGFATQALCENLGFQFNPNGSFRSETRSCIVVTNGKARGIGLEQFQTKCKFMAARLYRETESLREIIFEGKEGMRVKKERES